MLDQLVSSNALQISRFPDFDRFRSIEQLAEANSIPLAWKGFAASFAAVSLRSCTIYLQRTFPRILHVRYLTSGAVVGFSMADTVALTMNGIEARPQALLLAKGDAVCEMVEPQANLVAMVNFAAVEDRGWPGEANSAQFIALRPTELAALRAVTRDILLLASNSPDLLAQPRVVEQLEESLLEAVDHAVQMSPIDAGPADLGTYLVLVRKLDEFLHDNAAGDVLQRRPGAAVQCVGADFEQCGGRHPRHEHAPLHQAAAALERAPAAGAGRLDRRDEGDRARQRLLAHGRVPHAVPRPVR